MLPCACLLTLPGQVNVRSGWRELSPLQNASLLGSRQPLGCRQASAAQGRHHFCAEWGLPGCAGIVRTADFLDMTDTDFDAVLDVNLKGAFIVRARISCCHIACMPYAEYLLHR